MVWDVDLNKLLELIMAIYELNKVLGDVERLDELVDRLLDAKLNVSLSLGYIPCFYVEVEKVFQPIISHEAYLLPTPFKEEELWKGAVEVCNGKLRVYKERDENKWDAVLIVDGNEELTLRELLYLYYLEVLNPGLFNKLIEKGREISESLEKLRKLLEQVKGVVEVSSK